MAAGDGLVRPLNAPPGQQTPIGVQPGTTPGILIANKVIVFGANGGIFVYSGTPALGNLIASIAAASGTDSFGNAYGPGFISYGGPQILAQLAQGVINLENGSFPWTLFVDNATQNLFIEFPHTGQGIIVSPTGIASISGTLSLSSPANTITLVNGAQSSTIGISAADAHPIFSEEIELAEVAVAPSAPGNGIKVFSDASGVGRLVGEDTSVVALGARRVMFTGTDLINATAFATLNDGTNNLSSNVGAGRKYMIRAKVIYQATSGVVGSPAFHVTAPASTGGLVFDFDFNANVSGVSRYDNASGFGSSQGGPAHATAGAATFVTLDILGTASFSASGTVAVAASINGAGNSTFTVQQGSFIEVSPI